MFSEKIFLTRVQLQLKTWISNNLLEQIFFLFPIFQWGWKAPLRWVFRVFPCCLRESQSLTPRSLHFQDFCWDFFQRYPQSHKPCWGKVIFWPIFQCGKVGWSSPLRWVLWIFPCLRESQSLTPSSLHFQDFCFFWAFFQRYPRFNNPWNFFLLFPCLWTCQNLILTKTSLHISRSEFHVWKD